MVDIKNSNQPKKNRRDLQALRAYAVVAVVVYHLWPERLVGGFTGVDIFFVLSGYLMTVSILGRLNPLVHTESLNINNILKLLIEFYARRIKRLLPAALATLAGVLSLSALTNNLTIIIDNTKSVISAATFWENWYLAERSVDYLHQGDSPVATQHFWSLSVEEQFYLAWPILLILSTIVTLNIVILYKRQKIGGALLPLALLTLISFAYGYWLLLSEPSVAYFSTPARVWELMIGGLIAFLPVIKNYDLKLLLPHIGLIMCLYSVVFVTGDGFPGWQALIPTIGAALIIMGGIGKPESSLSFDNIFRLRAIQWIGDISYSIYLWHWPLIVLLPVILQIDIDGAHGKLFKCGIIILTLILAHLSYKFIEKPTRNISIGTRKVFTLFILSTVLIVGCSLALKHFADQEVAQRINELHSVVMNTNNECIGARAILNQSSCGNPYGVINDKFMSIGKHDPWNQLVQEDSRHCFKYSLGEDPHKFCEFGDLRAKRSIALIGDSHAEQYINTFNDIGKRNHIKFVLLGLSSCAHQNPPSKEVCNDRLAFITSSGLLDRQTHILLSPLLRTYSDTIHLLDIVKNATSTPIFLINDIPRTTYKKLNNCYTFKRECAIPRDLATNEIFSIVNLLIENNDIKMSNIIDFNDLYCDPRLCYASIGGVPVYWDTVARTATRPDNSHATPSYSLTMSIPVEDKLRKLKILQ